MIKALKERGPEAPVIEVMRSDIPIVEHRRNLEEALRVMQEKRLPAVGVNDGAGRLIGLITPENIGEMMMIQAARPERRARAPWGRSRRGSLSELGMPACPVLAAAFAPVRATMRSPAAAGHAEVTLRPALLSGLAHGAARSADCAPARPASSCRSPALSYPAAAALPDAVGLAGRWRRLESA